ncbi:TPA: hypothetical protein NIF41_004724 [Pseudomonas aeruginosa]|nr:hypothetical protein [Pseudomonas aeruginosa]HBO4699581.1 hypothetical protein [Pseudomonas aeruginosa]HCF4419928.1 hypothetical protein [Pseudomonas aeruginosa]HCI2665100.1 hypothetical protein [Pseudomonas aeruginosa]
MRKFVEYDGFGEIVAVHLVSGDGEFVSSLGYEFLEVDVLLDISDCLVRGRSIVAREKCIDRVGIGFS